MIIVLNADEADSRRPETVQVADLKAHVLHLLGIGPAVAGHPVIRNAKVLNATCVSSPRHTTPLESAVQEAEGVVRTISEETTTRVDIDVPPEAKPPKS